MRVIETPSGGKNGLVTSLLCFIMQLIAAITNTQTNSGTLSIEASCGGNQFAKVAPSRLGTRDSVPVARVPYDNATCRWGLRIPTGVEAATGTQPLFSERPSG